MGLNAFEMHEMDADVAIAFEFCHNEELEGLSVVTASYLFREDINSTVSDVDVSIMMDIFYGLLPADVLPGYDHKVALEYVTWMNAHHTHAMPEDVIDEPQMYGYCP